MWYSGLEQLFVMLSSSDQYFLGCSVRSQLSAEANQPLRTSLADVHHLATVATVPDLQSKDWWSSVFHCSFFKSLLVIPLLTNLPSPRIGCETCATRVQDSTDFWQGIRALTSVAIDQDLRQGCARVYNPAGWRACHRKRDLLWA